MNLHLGNARIAHQAGHIRHATTLAKALGHLAHARVAHDVVQHIGVAHEVLSHASEHRVVHHRTQVGHATATTTHTTHQTGQRRQIRHTAGATGCAGSIVQFLGGRLGIAAGLLDLPCRGLKAATHGIAAAVTLGLNALLVSFLGSVVVTKLEPGEAQTAPGLGVLRIRRDGKLGVLGGLVSLSGGGISGSTVGEVDRVGGGDLQSLGVLLNGGGVILLGHESIALGLQLIGLGGRRARLGLLGLRLLGASIGLGRRLVAQLLVDAVDVGQRLPTNSFLHGSLVSRINLEGIGDTRLGDLDRFGIVGGEGAVLQAAAEEVDDGQSQTLVAFVRGLRNALLVPCTCHLDRNSIYHDRNSRKYG